MSNKDVKARIDSLEKELKELKKTKRRHKWWLVYLLWNK
jgi:hypothetical protein